MSLSWHGHQRKTPPPPDSTSRSRRRRVLIRAPQNRPTCAGLALRSSQADARHGYARVRRGIDADYRGGRRPQFGIISRTAAVLLALIEVLSARVRSRYERRAEQATSRRAHLYAFIDARLALGTDASPEAVACWVGIGAEALREKTVQAAYRRSGLPASAVRRMADGLISAHRPRS
jgi:hypothetical protein